MQDWLGGVYTGKTALVLRFPLSPQGGSLPSLKCLPGLWEKSGRSLQGEGLVLLKGTAGAWRGNVA